MENERDPVTGAILDVSIRMHRELGGAMLESVYEQVLAASLTRRGLAVRRQVPIAIEYDGIRIANAFKADLIVEDRIIVELKSAERLTAVDEKQLLTYLQLTDLRVGLLINFGGATIKGNFKRFVL